MENQPSFTTLDKAVMEIQSATPASLPDLIGNTPLLRLNNLNPNPKV